MSSKKSIAVLIGGDGSLTGANLLRQEWPEHLASLLEAGEIDAKLAKRTVRSFLPDW